MADRAICIGPPPAAESYLRVDRIIDAARSLNADALHPGYGFLAESAELAEACRAAGVQFVGPSADTLRLLGDKVAARQLARSVSAPLTPGYDGHDISPERLKQEAEAIGYPVLIKAAAGGGGRGMRVAEAAGLLADRAAEAQREAQAAFGDGRIYLERYVQRPRHVEVQVAGDGHGSLIHIGERECSIQRRHQKIIEESPSPAVDQELRDRLTSAALAICRAARYVSLGTVEFLVDTSHSPPEFYFLEVNTRLQVEHPVTELVSGLDLVAMQIRIAEGQPLPFTQQQILIRGHAMETRITAEQPETGFLPSTGVLSVWRPAAGPGLRWDSGVEEGSEVTAFYDPMIAKLIAYGGTRDAAIQRLINGLERSAALGVATNIPYLLGILQDSVFRAGDLSTRFLQERMAGWLPPGNAQEEALLALAAIAVQPSALAGAAGIPGQVNSAWTAHPGWRNA